MVVFVWALCMDIWSFSLLLDGGVLGFVMGVKAGDRKEGYHCYKLLLIFCNNNMVTNCTSVEQTRYVD